MEMGWDCLQVVVYLFILCTSKGGSWDLIALRSSWHCVLEGIRIRNFWLGLPPSKWSLTRSIENQRVTLLLQQRTVDVASQWLAVWMKLFGKMCSTMRKIEHREIALVWQREHLDAIGQLNK